VIGCHDYLKNFLSAHVDGELDKEEEWADWDHVEGCERCRRWLEDERFLKELLRRRLSATAPEELRAKARAMIDDECASDFRR
jgi:anti-sigma factor RsiW